MSQNLVLRNKGLHTNNNPLSESTPAGSLMEAVNVVIDRSEIVEPRRGFTQYGDPDSAQTKQLLSYKDTVIKHYSNKLKYDSDDEGDFIDFTGDTLSETDTGLRIKSVEANGNLYLTSSTGIKKISAVTSADFVDTPIEQAGGVKAVDLNVNTDYTSLGFLEPNSKVAYRLVFGKRDNNENLLLGVPSSRAVVYNISSTTACITSISFSLPSAIDVTYFYQIYRTGLSTDTFPTEPGDPGDEMYLVLEDQITAADITAGEITVSDSTPDEFRANGLPLYTNPVSGEGISQANYPPPFAKDICAYKGFLFYGNTKTVQTLDLAFLTVSGITTGVSNFKILDGTSTETYLFRGTFETETIDYNTVAAETDFYNAAPGTARYFTIISADDERKYCIWFNKTVNDQEPSLSGYLNIEVDISASPATIDSHMTEAYDAIIAATDDFNLTLNTTTNILTVECSNNGAVATALATNIALMVVSKDAAGTGQDIATQKIFLPRTTGTNAPSVSVALEQIAKSLVDVVNGNSTIVNAYYSSDFTDIPGQIYLEQRSVTGVAFYLNSNVGSVFNPTLPASGSTVISTNEIKPNRIFYSKYQQPESVPLVNYIDIGPKDREIKRIIGLRDSLFILKEDGIYRLAGDVSTSNGSNNFTVTPFDFSAQVLAPDTAVVLNNQIYALSTQGVIVITDTGVSVISRPIENQILKIIRDGFAYKTASFGVSYESDRSYLLNTVTSITDTVATQIFRYNTFTNTWSIWDKSQTCGLVNFRDDKLYFGASDIHIIEQERKTLTRADHADRQYDLEVQLNGVNADSIELSSVSNVEIGDVLIQTQYLTAQQFNRVLRKLDIDVYVDDTDYYSLLELSQGENARSNLVELAQKLVADIGGATDYEGMIGDYSEVATNISVAEQTVITVGAHDIELGRWITISGSDSTPSIDGTWEVIAVGATTLTIDKQVTVAGSVANIQTDVNNFKDVQVCFNLIVAGLNTDPGVFYTNYLESSGTVDFEQVVTAIDINAVSVSTAYQQEFLFGEIILYKAIDSYITYNPQFFGDPSVEKQVREGTIMFENTNFSDVTISYKSDKSPSFSDVSFTKAGNGDWGGFTWGEVNWGGVSAPIPLRTYVPLTKQRCRFMNVKFRHKVAMEKYALYGISLTFRPYNVRAYK